MRALASLLDSLRGDSVFVKRALAFTLILAPFYPTLICYRTHFFTSLFLIKAFPTQASHLRGGVIVIHIHYYILALAVSQC